MPKRLILHVGMHKTGSSTLQSTLHRHRAALAQAGINYLDMGANHSRPLYSAFCTKPLGYHMNQRAGLTDAAALTAYNMAVRDELNALLAANTAETTIISGEDLSLLTKPCVPPLKEFIDPFFDTVLVVGYLRPARSFVNSLSVQAVKGGATLEHLAENLPEPAYQWRFNKYIEAFGQENVRLRPYVRTKLLRECIVADFLHSCDLPLSLHDDLTIENENVSLSDAGTRFLSNANAQHPVFIDGMLNPERPADLEQKAERMPGPAFAWPEDLLSQHLKPGENWDIEWAEKQLMQQSKDETPISLY